MKNAHIALFLAERLLEILEVDSVDARHDLPQHGQCLANSLRASFHG